jgi:hypothetical protein
MAVELEEFQLILLRRPDGAPDYDDQTSQARALWLAAGNLSARAAES